MDGAPHIHVKGAREHNLRNLELRLPRGRLIVITGPSGSGKSSLAFDTIYAEGYRKYMESLSGHAALRTSSGRRRFHSRPVTRLAIEQRWWWLAARWQPSPRSRTMRAALGPLGDNAAEGRRALRSVRSTTVSASSSTPRRAARDHPRALDAGETAVLRDELPRLRQRGFQRVRLAGDRRSMSQAIPTVRRKSWSRSW
jgi:excinuclease ABC subunit A